MTINIITLSKIIENGTPEQKLDAALEMVMPSTDKLFEQTGKPKEIKFNLPEWLKRKK